MITTLLQLSSDERRQLFQRKKASVLAALDLLEDTALTPEMENELKKLENEIFGGSDDDISDYEEAVKKQIAEEQKERHLARQAFDKERQSIMRSKSLDKREKPTVRKVKKPSTAPKLPVTENAKLNEFYQDFEAALSQIKNKRYRNDFDEVEQDEYLSNLRNLMLVATSKDSDLIEANEPATEKLKLLPLVMEAFEKKVLHEKILENDVLEAVKLWLEPYADGTLPSINLRKSLLSILDKLPIETHHLRESGLGKVVFFYTKLPRERPEVKKIAHALVSKWSRPILGFSMDYRDLSSYSQLQGVRMKPSQKQLQEEESSTTRIPRKAYFDFVKQPESRVNAQEKISDEKYKRLSMHLQRLKSKKK